MSAGIIDVARTLLLYKLLQLYVVVFGGTAVSSGGFRRETYGIFFSCADFAFAHEIVAACVWATIT